ncbi:hypothetical protein C7T35_01440 [Variovorax sp. WS11]|uniref:hypothetical protein n=1 Tax=Variovorax sp. WS11 TaxID=1105204 RepID=UPI000D0CD3C6|nr:hypothetical protein [Variovorax sp. WS11]NDZ11484.1 hypothetical protein [Variovorax sp. WS11]PSL86658.1 hypothetical protein C7T35_01440 [Variovorax sp. WS11]
MTIRDPFKFPKNRGGFSGLGRAKAGELDNIEVAFLRKKVPGATAIKKGEFLYVQVDPTTGLDDPYLWTAFEVNYLGNVYAFGLQTITAPNQRTRAKAWGFQVRTGDPYPFVEEPFWYPAQLYVGDDYALRLSRLNYRLFDEHPFWFGNDTSRLFAYLTWVRPREVIEQVPSLSPDNAAGKDITFSDKTWLTINASGAFASGWDAATEGYRFGWTGWRVPESSGELAAPEARCYYGSTATRTVSESVVETLNPTNTRIFWPWTVGHGKVAMLRLQPEAAVVTNAVGLKVTTDHGATWSTQNLPELQDWIFHYLNGAGDDRWNHVNLSASDRACMSPIGEGRIALVLLCSKEEGRTWTNAEVAAAQPYLGDLTCWRFFLSDETGANYENVPWPLDASPGIRLGREAGGTAGIDFSGLHPAVEFARLGLGGAPMSAGPGSFFMSVGQWTNASGDYADFDENAVRFLWTTDYGATWALSDLVPDDAISRNPQPFNPSGQTSFSIPKVAVAKPLTPESNGALYIEGLVPLVPPVDGYQWVQNVYRTDATFSSFKKVATNRLADTSLAAPFGTFPPPGYMPGPVYVGNKQANSRFKPLVRPGYPEFEKPATP